MSIDQNSPSISAPARTALGLRASVNCPHCWGQFPPENLFWISQHANLRGDPLLGSDAQRRFLPTRFNVQGNALDSEGLVCHELACPHCHLSVPRAFLEMRPLFFSIVGTPSCGKSYFLSSLIWRLRQLIPEKFALSFGDADPVANRVLNYYEEQQFYNPNQDALVKLAKTEEFGDLYDSVNYGDQTINYPRPFVFAIRPLQHHPNAGMEAVSAAICLYDNAGESFEPGKDTSSNPVTRHLAQANALFFLYDPTQVPNFRQACQGLSNDPQIVDAQVTARQETTLHEMASRIRRYAGLNQKQRHQRPLVVIVTKFDAWSGLLPSLTLEPPYLPSTHMNLSVLDIPKIEAVSQKLRSLLFRYTPELVSAAEGFSEHVIYIPVSATGQSPTRDERTGLLGMRPRDIQPVWVEVPMLWTLSLWGKGLIPYKKPAQDRQNGFAANS